MNEEGSGLVVDGGHGSVEVHTAIGSHLAHIHLHPDSEHSRITAMNADLRLSSWAFILSYHVETRASSSVKLQLR